MIHWSLRTDVEMEKPPEVEKIENEGDLVLPQLPQVACWLFGNSCGCLATYGYWIGGNQIQEVLYQTIVSGEPGEPSQELESEQVEENVGEASFGSLHYLKVMYFLPRKVGIVNHLTGPSITVQKT